MRRSSRLAPSRDARRGILFGREVPSIPQWRLIDTSIIRARRGVRPETSALRGVSSSTPPSTLRVLRAWMYAAQRSIGQRHDHDRVRRSRTHARADAAPGAHIGSNRGPARDDIDGTGYRAAFRAHGTERAGMREAGHRLDPCDTHLPRLIRTEHPGLACSNARGVLAHDARGGVQVDHRCARRFAEAGRCVHNGADRTCRDALIASRAAGEERDFVDGARRTMDRQGEPPADSGRTHRLPVVGCLSCNRGARHRRGDPLGAVGRRLDDPTEQSSPQEITPG